jgi:hypothetical protein
MPAVDNSKGGSRGIITARISVPICEVALRYIYIRTSVLLCVYERQGKKYSKGAGKTFKHMTRRFWVDGGKNEVL